MGYDICIIDYRGFGKSGGCIENEAQFFHDVQQVYDIMKSRYDENDIVVLGYSIGTAAAAKVARDNSPKHLILQAPYVSLVEIMDNSMSFLPSFLLKYQFRTDEFLNGLEVPITIFHGNLDKVIPYQSSLDLKQYLKKSDSLITLKNQGHNGYTSNRNYLEALAIVLE